jgi:2'-hydroxyisoflavone reductase
MKLLIAGGSSFVGRAIALAALEHGHDVTVINRGVTPTDLPDTIERLVGDRHGDLSALDGRHFDATIDSVAYQRRDVEGLAAALGGRGGHYLHISSISAYAEPRASNAGEDTPLLPLGDTDPNADVTGLTYGVLKAECERAALELFDRVAIIRPTYVLGAFDKTMRFPYWIWRAQQGGRIAVPAPVDGPLQWIDARDLGAFTVHLAETAFCGAVHVNGPSPAPTYHDVIRAVVARVAPEGTTLETVPLEKLTGPSWYQKFPLWSGGAPALALQMDNSYARSLGLTLRSLDDTIDNTAHWLAGQQPAPWWLSANEEGDLFA